MITRRAAILALFALFGFAAENRLSAQPLAPARPPNSAFGNIFGPGSTVVPNAGVVNNIPRAGAGNNFGPGTLFAPGFGQGNYYGPFTPYVLSTQPVVFNNRGHWYSLYYGHWYPNGLTSGVGVLSNGGNGGGYNRLVGTGTGVGASSSAFGVSPVMGAGTPGAGLPGAGGIGPGVGQPGIGLPQAMPGVMTVPVIGGFPR